FNKNSNYTPNRFPFLPQRSGSPTLPAKCDGRPFGLFVLGRAPFTLYCPRPMTHDLRPMASGETPLPLPTLPEIEAATALIRPHVRETPVYRWPLLEAGLGVEVWIKHENHTPVGAFKIRGGLVYLDELKRREPGTPGVIAATTGNHGQSIAYAAREHGLRAVIVVPHGNNPEKNAAMRSLGAELVEHGREFQESLEFSRELAAREGLHPVPSFHPWLVRGVATYGLELFRSVP